MALIMMVVTLIIVFIVGIVIFALRYKRVPPNKVMIVYGLGRGPGGGGGGGRGQEGRGGGGGSECRMTNVE